MGLSKLKSLLIAAAFVVSGATGAHATLVTVNFNGINQGTTFDAYGFHFQFTGNHTDSSTEVFFHDGGDNPGDNDLIVTFDGKPFSLISLTWTSGQGMTVSGNDGQIVDVPNGPFGAERNIGIFNVVSATFETGESGSGFNLLVLDTDPPQPVPEPGPLGLLTVGLVAITLFRRRQV
jgi:hypothetical protein